LVARYDFYDPNTDLAGNDAQKDLYYQTLSIAWQHYFNDNIRISVNYEMPKNETNADYNDLKDNVLGIRIQASF